MFDERKMQELENKSHVRGKLNKEFFSSGQDELERKRREMKAILDEQVNERRRQKQKQKYEEERKQREEDQRLKSYYAKIEKRQKKLSSSRAHEGKKHSGVYDSKVSIIQKQTYHRYRAQSNNAVQSTLGDMPVMPAVEPSTKTSGYSNNNNHKNNNSINYQQNVSPTKSNHYSSMGNIPLLELTPQELKKEQKKRVKSKNPKKEIKARENKEREEKDREKDRENEREQKERSRDKDFKEQKQFIRERRHTMEDEQLQNSRQNTQFRQIFQEINEEIEAENKNLREELKKNQQAISLLMGAVKSNSKLDKFRIQAQKVLHSPGQEKQKQSKLRQNTMFPELKVKHQSILHDYIFRSAYKAQSVKAKNQLYK